MRAIVFDFFGTLTDPDAEPERRAAFGATAAALGVDPGTFWSQMSATFPDRIVGSFGGTRDALEAIARRCGADPDDARLDHAVEVHRHRAEALRRPRPGVLAVLDELRSRGFRLGLISDCGSELVESWTSTPYATHLTGPVFSWQEGHRKPDPRLYATAAERLDVPAAECWFVGDGGSREHQGARDAGMRPVLVTNAAYPDAAHFRVDPDGFRPDSVIDDPKELPDLVGYAES